ncbi:related to WD repeat-containing protein YMR102C [Nakaseomyces glabratus]|nr:Trp-Asp (WD) repeats profile [Nakaseomyces glabratus]QNG15537.1 uncharacterized protein GWK60_K03223 [Nakaseomyces glabratus]SCV14743.1 related to WD repeat-containing protein YMR102C [Nakaseomyces glabratus]SLM13569.1 related to WD repeat-containing protein YMR102C [Nakaseomyces glabratus]
MTRFNFAIGHDEDGTTDLGKVATDTTTTTGSSIPVRSSMDSDSFSHDEDAELSRSMDDSRDAREVKSMNSEYSSDDGSKDRTKKEINSAEYSADIQPLQFKMSRRRTTQFDGTESSKASRKANASGNGSDPIKTLRFDEGSLSSSPTAIASDATRASLQRDTFAKVREHIQRGSVGNSGLTRSDFNPFAFIDREQFETYLKEPRYIRIFKKRSRSSKQFRRLFLAQELKTTDEFDDIEAMSASLLSQPDGLKPNTSITNATLNGNNFHDNINDPNHDMHSDKTFFGTACPVLPTSGHLEPAKNTKAIWSTKFSIDGKYMATGSRDGVLRLWKVLSTPVERWGLDSSIDSAHLTSAKSLRLQQNQHGSSHGGPLGSPAMRRDTFDNIDAKENSSNLYAPVFQPTPVRTYKEHLHDVLDMDWSKNNFLISASMDKTAKLWHPSKMRSLKSFQHPDFVTCVKFHPTDDRFFISGCLDQKCRLWSILDDEVSFEFNCRDLVTSLTLTPGDGTYTIVGTFNGYIHVLQTKGLEHITSFHVTAKKTHENTHEVLCPSNDSKVRHGPRVTGLQCFNSLIDNSLRLVVTSSDSRIRVFDLTRRKLIEILRGFQCGSSQHKAQISVYRNQPIVINSSDDHWVYGWRLKSSDPVEINKKAKKHGMSRSGSIRGLFSKSISRSSSQGSEDRQSLRNTLKLSSLLPIPHSSHSDGVMKNSDYFSFHAHNAPVTTVTMAPEETSKTLSLSNDPICELSLEFFEPSDEVDIIKLKDSQKGGHDNIPATKTPVTTSLAKPTPVEVIGSILISTDSNGLIRVFRADMSKSIRARVLQKLQKYNREMGKQYGSTDSLVSENDKSRPNLGTVGHQPSTNSTSFLSSTGSTNTTTVGSGSKASITRNHSFRSLKAFKSPTANFSNTALGATMNRAPRESISSVRSDSTSNTMTPMSFPGLKCHVCDGTKFEPLTRSSGSQDKSYFCVDCKTLLNNFR